MGTHDGFEAIVANTVAVACELNRAPLPSVPSPVFHALPLTFPVPNTDISVGLLS